MNNKREKRVQVYQDWLKKITEKQEAKKLDQSILRKEVVRLGNNDYDLDMNNLESFKNMYDNYSKLDINKMEDDYNWLKTQKNVLEKEIKSLNVNIQSLMKRKFIEKKLNNAIKFFSERNKEYEKGTDLISTEYNSLMNQVKGLKRYEFDTSISSQVIFFYDTKIKDFELEKQLKQNFWIVLNQFGKVLKRSIYEYRKEEFMNNKEVK